MERKESRNENKSEHTRSHRSSISNLSTADSSLKKDLIMDQKEDFDIKLSPKSDGQEHKEIEDIKKSLSKTDDHLEPEETILSQHQSLDKRISSSEKGISNRYNLKQKNSKKKNSWIALISKS